MIPADTDIQHGLQGLNLFINESNNIIILSGFLLLQANIQR